MKYKLYIWFSLVAGFVSLMASTGCSTGKLRAGVVAAKVVDYRVAYALDAESATEPLEVSQVENLALPDALFLALQSHPELRISDHEMSAAQARALQEGLWLNPTLEVEVENFGGSGEFEGFDSSETTIVLGQTFELGGKRYKRTAVAEWDAMLSEWDYVITWLDVVAETSKRFAVLQAAVRDLELAESDADAAKRIHDVVIERVKAGRDTVLEEMKVKSMLASTELSLVRAKSGLNTAKEDLMLMWSGSDVHMSSVTMEHPALTELPPLEQLLSLLDSFPELQKQLVEVQLAESAVDAAKADRIPDLELAGGYKQSRGDDEQMFVAGAGVDLPLFNRNQGGIREASVMLSKARTEQMSLQKQMKSMLVQTYQRIVGSRDAAEMLGELVVPASRAAFEAAEEGYRAGKYTCLDMLDAQRSLFESERELVQARLEYLSDMIDLERLIGTKLSALQASAE